MSFLVSILLHELVVGFFELNMFDGLYCSGNLEMVYSDGEVFV